MGKMIVVKLQGGLGNQMFQYALGRHLSVKNRLPLKLDVSWLGKAKRPFTFRLSKLNIAADIATDSEIAEVKYASGIKASLLSLLGRKPVSKYYVNENGIRFQSDILDIKGSAYLDGYWASERYFSDISDTISSDFAVKNALEGENKRIAELIASTHSVSLHVRRGDFVSDPAANRVIGTCSPDYYSKAVEMLVSKVPAPHYFIFSDDHVWARDNIKLSGPVTSVGHNSGPDNEFEDMRLMSLCKHNITANSSFSWWGAWLNKNQGKIVIAPRKWLADPNLDTADVVPSSWIKI